MRSALSFLVALLVSCGAAAQQNNNPNVLFTGSFRTTGPNNYDEQVSITCRGMPTCFGSFTAHIRGPFCPNYVDYTGTVTINNLNLAQSGPLQGSAVVRGPDIEQVPGGPCTVGSVIETTTLSYTGNWNRTTGRGTLVAVSGSAHTDTANIAFSADLTATQPVFPMTVNAKIDAGRATATATINFRPEDVGRNGSVFVFASAPAARVQGGMAAKVVKLGMSTGSEKADPQPCVLAQMSPQGQLTAVTTSQLSAFTTGVLSAAGTSVNILNNTPTPGVAGSTFYVGYGPSASAMLDNGIFRNAVLIPGDSVCPMLPYVTALWLHPQEAGWGLNVIQQGSTAFATLFTYDASRQPLWLLMSGGSLQSDGLTFTGDLFRTTGPAFSANPFTPIAGSNYTRVGTMSMSLTEANAAQLRYTMNGVEVQKSIQRFVFGSHAANCLPTSDNRVTSTNYTDLWWKADESGWGLNITHQDDILFGTLFNYAAGAGSANTGLWLVMSEGRRQGDGSYLGNLYRTTGPAFNAVPFTPITAADQTVVGTMRLRFSDGITGTLEYSVNGTNVTKPITRIPFSTPVAACN